MGIDAGFDMVPCLSKAAVDKQNWQSFLKIIKERYQKDDLVEIKSNYLEFKVSEHPQIPFEDNIDTLTRVSRACFGSRIRYWNNAADELGFYNWQEVHDSIKSYEQVWHACINWLLRISNTLLARRTGSSD